MHDPSQIVRIIGIITLITTIIISKTAISYWSSHILQAGVIQSTVQLLQRSKEEIERHTVQNLGTEFPCGFAPNITFLWSVSAGDLEATHIMQHTHISYIYKYISVVGLQNYPFLIIFTSPCARANGANAFSSCQVAKAFASSETTVIVAALGL